MENMPSNKISSINNSSSKIIEIIKELAKNSVFPCLNNVRLLDVLNEGSVEVISFIRDNSILSNVEDMILILKAKYQSVEGEALKERKFLEIYQIIFGEKLRLDKDITIFSGGTGSNRLTKGLLEKGADLTLLINAYDDGKSTGHIRENLNLLGPSDIAKNLIALMGDSGDELRKFLEYRLPKTKTSEQLRNDLRKAVLDNGNLSLISELLNKVNTIVKTQLKIFLREFERAIFAWETKNHMIYDLKDYGIRNMIYVGAHLHYNKDYHYTNKKLIELFGLLGNIVLNNQEPLWLIAITEKGNLLNCESEVVSGHIDEEISEIFLAKKPLNDLYIEKFYSLNSLKDKIDYIKSNFAVYPHATEEAIKAIKNAELIIFAPTTFHSSLAPTLITKGVSNAINQSSSLKVAVANLIRERGYHTLGENLIEFEKYLNLESNKINRTELDYVIINTHGHRTDGVVNANRLPVDRKYISQIGTELIEVKLEDLSQNSKHKHKLLSQIIHSLKAIDDLGYRINRGKLLKKGKVNVIENKREQLKQLLNNPFLYKEKEETIERLVMEILGIGKIRDFKPITPIKVIILGAGKSTRLNSKIPKIIYPINGKENLAYLLEKYSEIDEKPIVVVNETDVPKLREWSKIYPKYNAKVITTKDLRGTAMSLLDIMKREFNDFEGDIFLSWGDITNIKLDTIKLTCAIHQALGNVVMTMPTCWEKNPYAGIVRNNDGRIIDVFITKEQPEQKKNFGEHDGSIFIFKSKEMIKALTQLSINSNMEEDRIIELNFLKTIPLLANKKCEIIGITSADPRECFGFNTQEEAKLVEQYMKELNETSFFKETVLDLNLEEYSIKQHSLRLKEYLKQNYKALMVDVDETITDDNVNVPDDVIEILVKLSNNSIPIGIVTVRQNNSLTEKLLFKILSHQGLAEFSKNKFYIYPENAAYCYRLDKGVKEKIYDEKMPSYIVETALKLLRKNVLKLEDDYIVTDYKIHILPKNPNNQKEYVGKINSMFKMMNIPLVAYRSNTTETSGSIVISKLGVDKAFAMFHFRDANNISLDEIAKIGDMGGLDSSDNSLLRGVGSFSVNEYDINSEWQVSLLLSKGSQYKGVNGSRWLLNNLKFSI